MPETEERKVEGEGERGGGRRERVGVRERRRQRGSEKWREFMIISRISKGEAVQGEEERKRQTDRLLLA